MASCCSCCDKPGKDPRCCVCMPYGDPCLVTAQIISIISFSMSWVWWVTFVLATPVVSILMVAWCFKMGKRGFLLAAVLAGMASIASLFTGLWIIFKWKDDEWCSVFVLTFESEDYKYYGSYVFNETTGNVTYVPYKRYNDENNAPDFCREIAWAIVAFVNCLLFAAIAFCTARFATARLRKFFVQKSAGDAADGEQTDDAYHVEMESFPPGTTAVGATASAVAVDDSGGGTARAADANTATPTTVAAITATASALPPEVLAKIEDQDY